MTEDRGQKTKDRERETGGAGLLSDLGPLPSEAELRAAIVAVARGWVGTPHMHQACKKGAGVDCTMLVRAVGEAAGALRVSEADAAPFANYSRTPDPALMERALRRFLVEIDESEAGDGDLAWIEFNEDLPRHLAILATRGRRRMLIHALARPGRNVRTGRPEGRVVEHGFAAEWPDRVVKGHGWWRYPGLESVCREAISRRANPDRLAASDPASAPGSEDR